MVNFPTSFDDDTTLYIAVNNKRTALTAGIDNSTLTIPVASTAGFPDTGFITILSNPNDVTEAEAIEYTSITPTQFNASQRGAGGTTAVAHNASDNVDLTIVAAHHNELKDAIIELEHFVGVSGSENFVRLVSGNAVIPGQLTLNTLSANTITASGTMAVSGTPVHAGDPLTINTLNAINSLTISGSPVSTGTIDLQLLDTLYVNVTGDSMTGDLDMQGNVVKNTGVVVIQDNAPSLTPSGLLWLDTDECDLIASTGSDRQGGFRGALISTTSGVQLTNGTFTLMVWDLENKDNGDWFDPAFPNRLTVPSGVTEAQFFTSINFGPNSTGDRRVEIFRNGTTASGVGPASGVVARETTTADGNGDTVLQAATPVLTVSGGDNGDYFEVRAFQNSGGVLEANIDFSWFASSARDTRGVPGVNTVNLLQGDVTIAGVGGTTVSTDDGNKQVLISGGGGSLDELQGALIAQVFGS